MDISFARKAISAGSKNWIELDKSLQRVIDVFAWNERITVRIGNPHKGACSGPRNVYQCDVRGVKIDYLRRLLAKFICIANVQQFCHCTSPRGCIYSEPLSPYVLNKVFYTLDIARYFLCNRGEVVSKDLYAICWRLVPNRRYSTTCQVDKVLSSLPKFAHLLIFMAETFSSFRGRALLPYQKAWLEHPR